jgi:hypothetical protein
MPFGQRLIGIGDPLGNVQRVLETFSATLKGYINEKIPEQKETDQRLQ